MSIILQALLESINELCGVLQAFIIDMSNGVRHLFWDLGRGFNGKSPLISTFLVLASTLLLTSFTILLYIL